MFFMENEFKEVWGWGSRVGVFYRKNNLSEYEALFEKRWTEINNSNEDILKLKLAKNSLGERRTSYGK